MLIGYMVYAKAATVPSLSECACRYKSETKELYVVVKEVVLQKSSKITKTLMSVERYCRGGTTKTRALIILAQAAKPLPAVLVLEVFALCRKLSAVSNKNNQLLPYRHQQ